MIGAVTRTQGAQPTIAKIKYSRRGQAGSEQKSQPFRAGRENALELTRILFPSARWPLPKNACRQHARATGFISARFIRTAGDSKK